MTWFKMPLFLWATYATSLINILGTPVIAITALLVAAERLFNFGFFDPSRGGDPVLFQHLFWFYSHPAVYIMILPAMGVISELVAAFCRKPVFGYTLRGVFEPRHRRARLPRVGSPHVRRRPVGLRVARVLAAELPGGDPVGREGLQLDGDDVQGIGVVADADALRDWLHRPVHDRRADGLVSGVDRAERARDRHLLHHRALPLHHGRRHDHGLPRRPALLVAEDQRPHVSGRPVEAVGRHHLHRVQPDVLPAVPARLSRHAAPLSRVSARVSGVERAVVGRRVDSRRGISAADGRISRGRCGTASRPARTRGARPASNGRRRRRRRQRTSR